MCGIIGIYTNKGQQLVPLIKQLFLESQIRGKHATGISFLEGRKIRTTIKAVPSSKFVKEFEWESLPDRLRLIGHCRYSTSDLDYNQPIVIGNSSIVHNGVITQEDPKYWQEDYGYDCTTKNDSELLLHTLKEGDNPFTKYPNASIAAIHLMASNRLAFFRGGTRPLWYCIHEDAVIIASTENIITRAFEKTRRRLENIRKTKMGVIYTMDGVMTRKSLSRGLDEKQNHMHCAEYYYGL